MYPVFYGTREQAEEIWMSVQKDLNRGVRPPLVQLPVERTDTGTIQMMYEFGYEFKQDAMWVILQRELDWSEGMRQITFKPKTTRHCVAEST